MLLRMQIAPTIGLLKSCVRCRASVTWTPTWLSDGRPKDCCLRQVTLAPNKTYVEVVQELKNANSERELSGKRGQEQTVEGVGRAADPLEEYRREEERLRNTASPYVDGLRAANRAQTDHTFRPTNGISNTMPSAGKRDGWSSPAPQYRRGATPTGRIVREKPPTPPPSRDRDRSRSPARSPAVTAQRRQLQQQSEPPAPRTETPLQVGYSQLCIAGSQSSYSYRTFRDRYTNSRENDSSTATISATTMSTAEANSETLSAWSR